MRIFWPTWSEFGSTSGLSACSCSTVVPWSAAIVSKVSPSRIVYVLFGRGRGRGRVVPRSVLVRTERVAGGGAAGGSSFGSSPDRISKIATVAAARNAAGASNRGPQCVSRRRRRARGTGYQPEAAQTSLFSRAASEPAAVRQSASEWRDAYVTARETVTTALAGPLVNARATSAGVAPWAPTPGRSR